MRSHAYLFAIIALVVFAALGMKARGQSAQQANAADEGRCPVTLPRALPADLQASFGEDAPAGIWNGSLFTGGWPDGTIVFRQGGPGFVLSDGSLSMKFLWLKGTGLRGSLTVEGKRLDASAPPLRTHILTGFEDLSYQPSSLIFPTTGCWQVTAQVAQTKLTFVTRVVEVTGSK